MYVYIKTEPGLWTVGFYNPQGKFIPESDHNSSESAADRVAYLSGKSDVKKAIESLLRTDEIEVVMGNIPAPTGGWMARLKIIIDGEVIVET